MLPLLEKDLVVNIEGRFVNETKSRTSLDIQWRHHPQALDTFFVTFPNEKPFHFVTAGEYRASVPSDSSASATRSLPSPPATSPPSAADAPPMHQSVSAGRSERRIVARKVEVVVLPWEPQTA